MTDRDLQIGQLMASVESLRNQNADQFRRIDVLEVASGRLEERVAALNARLDSAGAPDPEARKLPDLAYSWRFWAICVAAAGVAFGLWTWNDVRGILGMGGPQ